MAGNNGRYDRRSFLKGAAAGLAGAALSAGPAWASEPQGGMLQVWSCGGLAEALVPANQNYHQKTGVQVAYTGAFAAALGKSLLGGATTEVFMGRVLALAQKLRKAGKMLYFKPLCFTSYVLVTPPGNPAGIKGIKDLARPGVRVVLAPEASPPGGAASLGLLKKAGILKPAMQNTVIKGTCVQRTMEDLLEGKGDVSVVETRLTRMKRFQGRGEIIPIPFEFFPPPPLTFTIGLMKDAADRQRAEHYMDYILSPEGMAYFDRAGFIPATSDRGQELTQILGVHDV